MKQVIAGLCRRQDGGVLVWVVLTAGMLVAASAFAIDIGRGMALSTELQQAADAAALAGARELDGTDGAMDRARAAALGQTTATLTETVTNDQRLHQGGPGAVAIRPGAEITFHETLSGPAITGNAPADHRRARFIRVRTVEHTVLARFLQLVSDDWLLETEARATAGNTKVACRVTPLMMCSPRPAGQNFDETYPAVGQQFILFQQADWQQPGNFGLLQPPSIPSWGNKHDALMLMLASPSPPICFVSEMTTSPGVHNGPMKSAINMRFDLYDNSANKYRNRIPSGPYPVRGIALQNKNNACSAVNTNKIDYTDIKTPHPLPRDRCFTGIDGNTRDTSDCDTSTPALAGGDRMAGKGDWTSNNRLFNYLRHNYFTGQTLTTAQTNAINGVVTTVQSKKLTRYELWLWEQGDSAVMTKHGLGDLRGALGIAASYMPPDIANGGASCYSGTEPRTAAQRIIYVAVTDCKNNPFSGKSGLPLTNVRFAKFFVTEPVNDDTGNVNANRIWGEYLGLADETDPVIRNIVQLYE